MSRSRTLCVLDFDGVGLRGAVVRVGGHRIVEVQSCAVSQAATPEEALGEVLHALGERPRSTVVCSIEVAAGLVRLPAASTRAAPDELAQMLRWEMEPLIAQQPAARRLGDILKARAKLGAEEIERIVTVVRERRAAGSRDAAALRFGSVACELGFVTSQQVAEALALQERLGQVDDEYAYGWSLQSRASDGDGASWLSVGMAAARRLWWRQELRARGARLLGVYPRLPGVLPALGSAHAVSIEIEPYAVARSEVQDGSLVALEIVPTSGGESAGQVVQELLEGTEPSGTYVSGSLASLAPDSRAKPLSIELRGEVGGGASYWHSLAGAALHAGTRGGPAAFVPARDLGPPLRRRPGVWWAAALAILAALTYLADRTGARSLSRAESEHAAAQQAYQEIQRGIQGAGQERSEAESLAEEVAMLESERVALRLRLAMLEESVSARARILPRLLDALAVSVNDSILIERMVEESPGTIRVEGRALSEAMVQAFTRELSKRITPVDLRLVDQSIRRETAGGRDGIYTFGLLLERHAAGEDA